MQFSDLCECSFEMELRNFALKIIFAGGVKKKTKADFFLISFSWLPVSLAQSFFFFSSFAQSEER